MTRPATATHEVREDGGFRVHRIVSPDIQGAWAALRARLGGDALVLRSREIREAGGFFGLRSRPAWEVQAVAWEDIPADMRSRYEKGGGAARPSAGPSTGPGQAPIGPGRARLEGIPGRADGLAPAARNEAPAADERTRGSLESMQRAVSEILQVVQGVEKLVRAGDAATYPEELRGIYLHLLENQVAENLSHDLMQGLMRELTDAELRTPQVVRARLLAAIERRVLTAGGIRLTPGRARVVALVGPTGVGKTTTLAKLATHFRLNERANVSFASIDTYRIGAAGQLQDYARILEVPVRVCLTPQDLSQAVAAHQGDGLVLIDTAGCSPRDSLRMRELKGFLDAAKPDEVHLVLTATAQPDHLFGVLDAYASFGIDRVILTKLDECTRFGLILNVLSRTQGALSYVTLGQCVPKDIAIANASKVSRLVLGEEPL